jgi:putative hydrolase of the HAD superfamily
LFDLGGVVMMRDFAAAARSLHLTEREFLKALFRGNEETVLIGKVTEDDWWREVQSRLALSDSAVCGVRESLVRNDRVDEGIVALLRALRGTMPIACVTNGWDGTRSMMQHLGVASLFDEIVISAEVGAAKPAQRIFEIAIERLAVPPSEYIFIDDAIDNVAAAARLGMVGYLHRRSQLTGAWLRARL